MDTVREVLESHFEASDWHISRPADGRCHESYLAYSQLHAVFVKFDVVLEHQDILSDLNVAPRLIADGYYHGRPYVIQARVQGIHPTREWLTAHISRLATTIRTYHDDVRLKEMLLRKTSGDGHQQATAAMNSLWRRYSQSEDPRIKTAATSSGIRVLGDVIGIVPADVVPTHGDLHPSNIIVGADEVRIVDWDGLTLCDRMRDLCSMLWRYVAKDSWPHFFEAYGIAFGNAEQRRFYWWLAHNSLNVAIWFARQADDWATQSYLDDYHAALSHLH